MTSRIGILGGMFDPVHNGHIAAARYAQLFLDLDTVKLIPCNVPNHRDSAVSSAEHRLNMLHLALESDPSLQVDPIELERSDVSYTVDTLQAIRQGEERSSLVFVLGADAFNSIVKWHRWQDLFELCHFLVLKRGNEEIAESVRDAVNLDERLVNSPEEMFLSDYGKVCLSNEFEFDGSSTEVRNRIIGHENSEQILDGKVLAYIKSNRLYI